MQSKSIKLTVLGSGTCVPRPDRASPGFYLEVGKTKILLDCGPGTVRQLVRAGKDYKDLDLIVISHLHVDHTGDLPGLFHALNYTPDFDRKKPVFILGGRGIDCFFSNLKTAFPHIEPRTDTYKIKFLDYKKAIKFNDLKLETIVGNHHLSSIVIKIGAFGKELVYTGDTDYDPKIARFSKEADLLITECSYPGKKRIKGHLTPKLVVKIASEAQVKSLLLTHFYPLADKVDIESQVKKYFSGEVLIAKDLRTVNV